MIEFWRSLLFVPADRPDLVRKAASCGADAVILDLEDAVPAQAKADAREQVARHAATLAAAGVAVLVRVNAEPAEFDLDLLALTGASLAGLVLPKCETAEDVKVRLSQAKGRGLNRPVVALLESPAAVFEAVHIASVPGVVALALGTEDFSLNLGAAPTPVSLDLPCRTICLAAAARHLQALAVPASIAAFREEEVIDIAARTAASFGATGMLCIHPRQVAIANLAFSPPLEAIEAARAIVEAWDGVPGDDQGVLVVGGRMVDRPVVEASRRLLARPSTRSGE